MNNFINLTRKLSNVPRRKFFSFSVFSNFEILFFQDLLRRVGGSHLLREQAQDPALQARRRHLPQVLLVEQLGKFILQPVNCNLKLFGILLK
jgi:hypothetical protein